LSCCLVILRRDVIDDDLLTAFRGRQERDLSAGNGVIVCFGLTQTAKKNRQEIPRSAGQIEGARDAITAESFRLRIFYHALLTCGSRRNVEHLAGDAETTGLPRNWKAPVTDLTNWPRMVHGITTEKAINEGKDLFQVLSEFARLVQQAKGYSVRLDADIEADLLVRRKKPVELAHMATRL